jgi:hypothetical protein
LCAATLLAGCHAENSTGDKKTPSAPPDTSVTIERVKHAQLKERLAALRGKIVVIDFWGEF